MKRELVFRPQALADLKDVYDYIERDNPAAAARYVEQIETFCFGLLDFPERGTPRDDLKPGIRIIGFRHRVAIAFVPDETKVEIARILYGGRDLADAVGKDEF